jgi:hypothetical protein
MGLSGFLGTLPLLILHFNGDFIISAMETAMETCVEVPLILQSLFLIFHLLIIAYICIAVKAVS